MKTSTPNPEHGDRNLRENTAWHLSANLFVCLSALMLWGCASPRVVRETSPETALASVRPAVSIAVLSPWLTYEETSSEALVDGNRYGAKEVQSDLVRAAMTALSARGFKTQQVAEDSPLAALTAKSAELLRVTKSPELLDRLKQAGRELSVEAVFVQHFRIKLGPGSSWDPWSGAITTAMNSGDLRVAIVDAQTGASLWQNRVYLREVPRVDRKLYKEAVDSLYQEAQTQKN